MLPKKNRGILLLALVLLVAAACALLLFFARQRSVMSAAVRVEQPPHNVYDRTLVVTADEDYDPYSFIDAQGQPSGHDIELIYLLADKMGYNVQLKLLPWREALSAVETGQADMVLAVAWAESEYPAFDLSVPLVNDPFVAFGKAPYSQIGELYDKRLAALENTGCISGFLKPYRLEGNTCYYHSISAAFAALQRGERDYVIARYSVGRRVMAGLDTRDIQAVGPTLLDNYICIGVRTGESELLHALDSAIIALSADGTLTDLAGKWLGEYVKTLTTGEFIRQNIDGLIICAGLFLLLFLVGFILISRTASTQKELALQRLAERDPLTGLYNRVTCERLIRKMLDSADPARDVHALLVLDIDDFKQVNDRFGHLEGDRALIRLAAVLTGAFRAGDIVGRLGGDEFFVFMPGCTQAEAAVQKARLVCLFSGGEHAGSGAALSASVGIAMYPAQGTSFAQLYKSADEALYEAKRSGKRGCAFYAGDGTLRYRGV